MRFINGTGDFAPGQYVLRPISSSSSSNGGSPPPALKKVSKPVLLLPPSPPLKTFSTCTSSLPAAFCPPATRILMPSFGIQQMTTRTRSTPPPSFAAAVQPVSKMAVDNQNEDNKDNQDKDIKGSNPGEEKKKNEVAVEALSSTSSFSPSYSPFSSTCGGSISPALSFTTLSSMSSFSSCPSSSASSSPSPSPPPLFGNFGGDHDDLMLKKKAAAAISPPMRCNFCRKNGEPVVSYSSHRLHNDDGTTQCPVLRSLVCKICAETGENAHTISYCPYAKILFPIIEESLGGEGDEARLNMGDLRMTRFSAAGKRQLKLFNPRKQQQQQAVAISGY